MSWTQTWNWTDPSGTQRSRTVRDDGTFEETSVTVFGSKEVDTGCTSSSQCASGFACVNGNCEQQVTQTSTTSGSTSGCGLGDEDGGGGGSCATGDCTEASCNNGECGDEECPGNVVRTCRVNNDTGLVECNCEPPSDENIICNIFCTSYFDSNGIYATGCSEFNTCSECSNCLFVPAENRNRCRPKDVDVAPCQCNSSGLNNPFNCEKCQQTGTLTSDPNCGVRVTCSRQCTCGKVTKEVYIAGDIGPAERNQICYNSIQCPSSKNGCPEDGDEGEFSGTWIYEGTSFDGDSWGAGWVFGGVAGPGSSPPTGEFYANSDNPDLVASFTFNNIDSVSQDRAAQFARLVNGTVAVNGRQYRINSVSTANGVTTLGVTPLSGSGNDFAVGQLYGFLFREDPNYGGGFVSQRDPDLVSRFCFENVDSNGNDKTANFNALKTPCESGTRRQVTIDGNRYDIISVASYSTYTCLSVSKITEDNISPNFVEGQGYRVSFSCAPLDPRLVDDNSDVDSDADYISCNDPSSGGACIKCGSSWFSPCTGVTKIFDGTPDSNNCCSGPFTGGETKDCTTNPPSSTTSFEVGDSCIDRTTGRVYCLERNYQTLGPLTWESIDSAKCRTKKNSSGNKNKDTNEGKCDPDSPSYECPEERNFEYVIDGFFNGDFEGLVPEGKSWFLVSAEFDNTFQKTTVKVQECNCNPTICGDDACECNCNADCPLGKICSAYTCGCIDNALMVELKINVQEWVENYNCAELSENGCDGAILTESSGPVPNSNQEIIKSFTAEEWMARRIVEVTEAGLHPCETVSVFAVGPPGAEEYVYYEGKKLGDKALNNLCNLGSPYISNCSQNGVCSSGWYEYGSIYSLVIYDPNDRDGTETYL